MTGHLDADEVASLRAGLAVGRRARRAAAHLASCTACAALDASVASVPRLLAAVPSPAIPPDVAARLDLALAAASAERPAPSGDSPADRPARSRAAHGRRSQAWPPRLSWRVLAPAAIAAAVIAGAAGFGLSQIGGGPSHSFTAAGGSGLSGRREPLPDGDRAAASGIGKQYQMLGGSSSAAALSPPPASGTILAPTVKMVAGSLKASHDTLSGLIAAQLKALRSLNSGKTASSDVADCVLSITDGDQPVLVEQARFSGDPAIIIVVRRAGTYHVWVAAAGCSASKPDVLDQTDVPDPAPGTSTP